MTVELSCRKANFHSAVDVMQASAELRSSFSYVLFIETNRHDEVHKHLRVFVGICGDVK